MSDTAIANVVTGCVTVCISVVGFLTLWVKLKYGVEKVERVSALSDTMAAKIDHNTSLTSEVKEASVKVGEHTSQCDERIDRLSAASLDHHSRLTALEAQMTSLKASVDQVTKNIDSTRHEIRSQMQTVMNKLDIMAVTAAAAVKPAEK